MQSTYVLSLLLASSKAVSIQHNKLGKAHGDAKDVANTDEINPLVYDFVKSNVAEGSEMEERTDQAPAVNRYWDEPVSLFQDYSMPPFKQYQRMPEKP
jgi:hypothetical protein